jgi:hypothetical protein
MVDRNVPGMQDQIQGSAEKYHLDAMAQVREFKERWKNIYDREEARWYQAGKEWKLAKEQDGHLSWKPYPKSVEATIAAYKAAVTGMTQDRQARDTAHDQREARETLADAIRTGYEEGQPLRPAEIARLREELGITERAIHPREARHDREERTSRDER